MTQATSIPKIDIRPDHWDIVHGILQKHVPQHAVWAFGSRAKWTAKEYSDLDLAVITVQPLPLDTSAALADDFSESDLPWKVDIVDWATTSESFRKVIERDRVVVQKAVNKAWRRSTWGDEIALEYGKALRGYENFNGNVRVFGSNGPIGWTDKALANGPGIILGRKGAYRGVQYSKGDFFVIDTAYYVMPKANLDMRWLYYAIQYHKLGEIDDGSPVPSTTRAAVYMRELDVPPEDVQNEIARVLGAIDDKITLNRRINQTLEAMAQAIFKSWFVDFDPVRAKIAARARWHAMQPGNKLASPVCYAEETAQLPDLETFMTRAAMRAISGKTDAELDQMPREHHNHLATTAALFPDEMGDSELGEIPKGWVFQVADLLTEVGIGKTPPRKESQWFTEGEGDWRWVSIKDMGASGVFQQRSSEFLTSEAVSRFNVRVVPDKTVLLSFKLTIGRVALTDGPMVTNEAIAHFKLPSDAAISSEYLYLYLKSFDYSKLGSTSSIADAVNSKTIREMPIILANSDLIDCFTKSVIPIFEEVRNLQNEIAALGAIRDTLLPKLLSGEIKVPA